MQQQGEPNVFNVRLRDGRNVNICTESGANAFLQADHQSSEILASNVEKMALICAKRKLNARDKSELVMMNVLFEQLSQHANHDVFREHVERSLLEAWLDHAIGQIKRFTKNRNWITTGKLPNHETQLLNSSISMMCHTVLVELAFASEFFHALADFVKARKGTGRALPCDDICDTITLIVGNAHYTSRAVYGDTWTPEKTFKKLEATGVLEQFLRCATVPQPHEFNTPSLFKTLDELQACVPFISKKLQKGQPCGDTVIAILEGKDGSRVQRPSVINKLRTMIRFASSIDPKKKSDDIDKLCGHCGKSGYSEAFQKSLMKCARCHQTYYCSRECQKADWKVHKKTCTPTTKKGAIMSANIQQTLMTFCGRNYSHIMVKMAKACEQSGLEKKDMIVELNFRATQNGVVPAMQDTPEFKVGPVRDYIEGSRPAEPDWFSKNVDRTMYEHNVNNYLTVIKDKHRKIQPNQFLFLLNYEGGFSCYSVTSPDPITFKETFTHEAVLAFQAYMNDDNDGPLSEIFAPLSLRKLKRELGVNYGIGQPDEEMIQDALDVLRMYEERHG